MCLTRRDGGALWANREHVPRNKSIIVNPHGRVCNKQTQSEKAPDRGLKRWLLDRPGRQSTISPQESAWPLPWSCCGEYTLWDDRAAVDIYIGRVAGPEDTWRPDLFVSDGIFAFIPKTTTNTVEGLR